MEDLGPRAAPASRRLLRGVLFALHALRALRRAVQDCLQAGFHIGPFRIKDAEIDCVADAPRMGDQMLPERALLFGTDALDGVERFLIESVGFELHANALPLFEGVP